MALARFPLAWLVLALCATRVFARVEPAAWTLGPVRWAGGPLALAGLALCLWALGRMRRHATTFMPGRDAGALVTDGPFALSRNPIYLGFALLAVGAAVAADAPLALVAPAALVLLIDRAFVRDEEASLLRAFGPAFEAYRRRTRRWL